MDLIYLALAALLLLNSFITCIWCPRSSGFLQKCQLECKTWGELLGRFISLLAQLPSDCSLQKLKGNTVCVCVCGKQTRKNSKAEQHNLYRHSIQSFIEREYDFIENEYDFIEHEYGFTASDQSHASNKSKIVTPLPPTLDPTASYSSPTPPLPPGGECAHRTGRRLTRSYGRHGRAPRDGRCHRGTCYL